jgi:hypothetical protein
MGAPTGKHARYSLTVCFAGEWFCPGMAAVGSGQMAWMVNKRDFHPPTTLRDFSGVAVHEPPLRVLRGL